MRGINPRLTSELQEHQAGKPIWKASPFGVARFDELVKHVARLAYANPDELLFFRGQEKDYQSKAGGTTLYPKIYRGDSLAPQELRSRFARLDDAAQLLVKKFKDAKIDGHPDLRRKASHLVARGVPLNQVQAWGGWSTIGMVMRYAHLAPNSGAQWIRVLESASGGENWGRTSPEAAQVSEN